MAFFIGHLTLEFIRKERSKGSEMVFIRKFFGKGYLVDVLNS